MVLHVRVVDVAEVENEVGWRGMGMGRGMCMVI